MTTTIKSYFQRTALAMIAAMALSLLPVPAEAQSMQDYPGKSVVHIIVPYPPGGTTDILGRIIAAKLGEALKATIIVDNHPGAGGNIAANLVAKATPDGHTLLFTAVTTPAIAHSLYRNLPYDIRKDFEPVAVVGSVPFVLLVANNVPAKTTQELIALAKAKPGQLNFGSAGTGTTAHLAGELFKSMADINIVHIPYKGNGPAMADLMANRLDMLFDFLPSAIPPIKSGSVRALAVSSVGRSAALPNVPTLAESGVPGYEVLSYFGLMAPAHTPKAIIDMLNRELNRISSLPDVRERYAREGVDPAAESTEWFRKYLDAEIVKWSKVVKESGARVD